MDKQQNWVIRSFKKDDENKIFELRRAIRPERHYTKEDWLKWWNWSFCEIPSGSRIWLAEINGKIVAQFALLCENLKVGENLVKAFQSIEESTHPDYRRQGIMSAMQRYAFDEGVKTGVNIFYGFPSNMAYSKDIKLGYFKVANLRKIYRILNWQNIVKTRTGTKFFLNMYVNVARMASNTLWRAPKVPVVKGLLVTRISNFDERIDEFCARVSNRFEIIVVRNKDYLNWRYSTVPGIKYSIYIAEDGGFVRGYIVFRYHYEGRKKMSVIYDLLTESEEISHHLLSRAESDCRKDDVDYILWSGIADKTYLRAYKNRGFVSVPFKNGQKFLVYSSDPNIPKHFLMNSSNWFIQMGDSDEL